MNEELINKKKLYFCWLILSNKCRRVFTSKAWLSVLTQPLQSVPTAFNIS